MPNTVEYRYNTVQYNTITLHWPKQNMNQSLNSQKTLHTYGVFIGRILEKTNRVIWAPYCILSLVALEVMTTYDATSDDKMDTMATRSFQCQRQS